MRKLVPLAAAATLLAAGIAAPAHAAVPLGDMCATGTVPDVLGETGTAAKAELRQQRFLKVRVSVQKSEAAQVVVTQIPAPGTRASRCDTVWLILGE